MVDESPQSVWSRSYGYCDYIELIDSNLIIYSPRLLFNCWSDVNYPWWYHSNQPPCTKTRSCLSPYYSLFTVRWQEQQIAAASRVHVATGRGWRKLNFQIMIFCAERTKNCNFQSEEIGNENCNTVKLSRPSAVKHYRKFERGEWRQWTWIIHREVKIKCAYPVGR